MKNPPINEVVHVPPENQGQIIEVGYSWDENHVYRITYDSSDGSKIVERAPIDDVKGDLEPWNCEPDVPAESWQLVPSAKAEGGGE